MSTSSHVSRHDQWSVASSSDGRRRLPSQSPSPDRTPRVSYGGDDSGGIFINAGDELSSRMPNGGGMSNECYGPIVVDCSSPQNAQIPPNYQQDQPSNNTDWMTAEPPPEPFIGPDGSHMMISPDFSVSIFVTESPPITPPGPSAVENNFLGPMGKGRGSRILTMLDDEGDGGDGDKIPGYRGEHLATTRKGRGRGLLPLLNRGADVGSPISRPGGACNGVSQAQTEASPSIITDASDDTCESCCTEIFEPPEKYRDVADVLNDSPSVRSLDLTTKREYWLARKEKFGGQTYIDTHCHLDWVFNRDGDFCRGYAAYKKKREDSWSVAYEGCIADFCHPDKFVSATAACNNLHLESDVYVAFGCHPHFASTYNDQAEKYLENAITSWNTKMVAIGEMGLDYSQNNHQDHEIQKRTFRRQLNLAIKYDKPLLIHCRDADDDCFEIMKELVPHDHRIHRHCFTGDMPAATRWTDYFSKLKIGLTPGIHAPRSHQIRVLKEFPLDRILIETDAPYFLPRFCKYQEYGALEVNHPGLGYIVGMKLAEEREMEVADVLRTIRANTKELYGI